jgi:hypothetical protein
LTLCFKRFLLSLIKATMLECFKIILKLANKFSL